MDVTLLIIAATLLLSAFFSGSEIAFVSTNKLRIQLQNIDESLVGRILSKFIRRPSRFLTAMLVGNNLAMVIYGIYFSKFIEQLWVENQLLGYDIDLLVFLVQTILASIVVLLFAEFLPKALFSISASKFLKGLAIPLFVIDLILSPVVAVVLFLSNVFLKNVLKVDVGRGEQAFDRVDLFHMISDEKGDDESEETDVDTEIFLNAIEFANTKIRDCMVPRTEIVSIDIESNLEELTELFLESGHSKIVVYKENIDQVVGYIHSIDLFNKPTSLNSIILPIPFVPESMQASDLLRTLLDKRRSMACVVDEFGGTSGIITVEDIVEEILGEIEDEHDVEELVEVQVSKHEFIFSARAEIEHINEKYDLNLPKGDYDTLGGFVIYQHEKIPQLGDNFKVDGFEVSIRKMDGARIAEIFMKRVFEEDE